MHFKERSFRSVVFCGVKVFCDFVTQYYELQDETTCTGKSANAAFRCIKNQLATRSGSLWGDETVFEKCNKIVVANPKYHAKRTFVSPKSQKSSSFSLKRSNSLFFTVFVTKNDQNVVKIIK